MTIITTFFTIVILLITLSIFMYLKYSASLMIELTSPKIKAIVGFEYWPLDVSEVGEDFNTLKLHFLWVALRWDWA